jgi:hypothetical protein
MRFLVVHFIFWTDSYAMAYVKVTREGPGRSMAGHNHGFVYMPEVIDAVSVRIQIIKHIQILSMYPKMRGSVCDEFKIYVTHLFLIMAQIKTIANLSEIYFHIKALLYGMVYGARQILYVWIFTYK